MYSVYYAILPRAREGLLWKRGGAWRNVMLRFSAHLGYLFTELPLADRFAAAAKAGFGAVEHPGPYELPASQLRALLADAGVEFVQLALPAGDAKLGEKGFAALPGREEEFLTSVRIGIEYAVAAGAHFIQVQSGLVPMHADPAMLWRTYIANLTVAADAAAEHNIDVLIEPIGSATISGYFMDRSNLAMQALEEVGRPNLHLLFDVFHSANAGIDPGQFVREHAARIGHLHIADYPGRNQPGTGTLDFLHLFRLIDEAGFSGFVGCEYKPLGGTEHSLDWYKAFQERSCSTLA